jgi:nitroimidazol reductase NimA-like FMN-containing flavoprotein (pyridoxamine 5'-phosphate oxidase superfamily)
MNPAKPIFRQLDRSRIEAILSRNHIGRIAFARGNQVEIVPVHYVHSGDWIYGRTTPGGTIEKMGDPWWPVAFQVDEIDGLFDWRSVVVKGGLYVVPPMGADWEREAWAEGVRALRALLPTALGEDDPVPERTTVFRIAVQETSGKEASTR